MSKPLYEPVTVFKNPSRRMSPRVIKHNETPVSKLYRLAAANARTFAQEFPKEAMEIVRQEILDKR